jgi:ATP-grasp domain/L-amino acid ligase C-terminal domain 2
VSLVILGASANIARVARSLGEPLVFVQMPGADARALVRDEVDELHTLDFTDRGLLESVACDLLVGVAPKGVVSVTERGLEPAALLSQLLHTPATPLDVVEGMRDKLLMRSRISAAGMAHLNPAYAHPADRDAVEELLAAGPVIVKPVDGTASERIVLVRSLREFDALGDCDGSIVESYVEGMEYSVDSFSEDGVHEIVGIAEKTTEGPFVEVSHVMPPPSLTPAVHARVCRAVTELLDALRLADGPAHTEVKVAGDEVVVLETHNRPGGDGLADLIAITRGVDWRRASLGWPLGLREVVCGGDVRAAAMVFFTAPAGRVTAIETPSLDRPDVTILRWGVEVAVGDRVLELRSSRDRVGWALLAGESPEACRAASAELRAHRIVRTDGGES